MSRQLLLITISLICTGASAQAGAPDPKPVPYSIAAHEEVSPKTLRPSCIHFGTEGRVGLIRGLGTRGGKTNSVLVLGVVDMSKDCLAGQIEATVPNGQVVGIQLLTVPGDECVAVPTFKADPKPDYLTLLAAFVKPFGILDQKDEGPTEQRIILPPAAGGTLTVPISCKKTPKSQIRTAVIHYKDPPQFSASAGTLVSLYGKHVFSVISSQTGTNSSGVATTQNSISLMTSKVQLVPIGFLNTYLSGTERLHLDLQAGLGINPNGSKTDVEYFFGPAIATHGVYLSPGLHIARASVLGGGFSVGETIPSGVNLPVTFRATYRFAFALSYSPSLKSTK